VVFHTLVQSFGKWCGSRKAGVAMLKALIQAGQSERDVEHFENAVEKAIPLHGAARAEIPLAEDLSVLWLVERIGLQLSFHHISLSFQPSRALEVLERCEHVLRTEEVSEGGVTVTWAKVFGFKALVRQATGDYKEAERLFRLALELRQKELGPGHPDTALSLNNLAALLKSEARFDEAERLCQEALIVFSMLEEIGWEGNAHWQLGMTNCLINLAGLLEMQGNHKEAKPLYMRALKIQEEPAEPLGPRAGLAIATTLDNLAGLLVGQNQYGEAEAFYRRALKLQGEELGDSHPDTARSLHNLAVLLSVRGEYGKAKSLHRLALKIREEKLGHENFDTIMSAQNPVHLLEFRGEYSEVEPNPVSNVGAREEPPITAAIGYFRASSETGTLRSNDKLAVPPRVKRSLQERRSNPNTYGFQSMRPPGSWAFGSWGDGDLRSWLSYSDGKIESSEGEKRSNCFFYNGVRELVAVKIIFFILIRAFWKLLFCSTDLERTPL
jgi:tetratricopeptide (TPR) repeat protein